MQWTFRERLIPSLLKEARDGAVRFNKIGEFVDGEQDFFFSSCQVTEGFFPAPKSPGFEKRVFEKSRQGFRKPANLLGFARAFSEEIDMRFSAHELLNKFCLADAALPPKNDQLRNRLAPESFEEGKLPFAIDEWMVIHGNFPLIYS